jgi:hypothetical protein
MWLVLGETASGHELAGDRFGTHRAHEFCLMITSAESACYTQRGVCPRRIRSIGAWTSENTSKRSSGWQSCSAVPALLVVGRFSRGKTSLMNAVLGTDRLRTGIRPLTSVITTVSYGSTEKAVIHYAGFNIPQEVRLAELPQEGNSGNRRNVRIADVQLPAELLRRGFHFVDTPGLGSPIIQNTRTKSVSCRSRTPLSW